MTIRAVVADDEPLAREGLRTLLARERDVEIVAECADGREAVERIGALRPDLLFLDVQMPELGGFDVVRAVGTGVVPAIVFVTAYDQHALDAFHVHAVDYLLKPVDEQRFAIAMHRARALLGSGDTRAVQRLTSLLERMATTPRSVDRLVVRVDGRTLFLRPEEIDRVEAEGNYARLVLRGRTLLVRESLADLERQLDGARFLRVHRSTILNVDRVREIQPMFKGDHVVITADGGRFPLSRKYRAVLEARLGKRI